MVINQARSKRKPSGSRYKKQLVRRQHEEGRKPALTKVDPTRRISIRTLGNNKKERLLSTNQATIVNKQGKQETATIKTIKDNPANRHFIRRNIITKGAIIETDKGEAVVTSRPGQDGVVHAKLL